MNDKTVATQQHDVPCVLQICAVAAIGGILFGCDTAVVSGAVMGLSAVCCLFCQWFVSRFAPETRGVSLEKMEQVILAKLKRHPAPDEEHAALRSGRA